MRLPAAPLRHKHDAEILRLAVPAFGALIAEPLFLLADSAIVGHLGRAQLAGLGIAATVLATAVSLSIFLAYGTTAGVARRMGAGDLAGALRLGIDGLWLAGLIGVTLAGAGYVSAGTVIGWFGPTAETAEHARSYLQVSMVGLPAMLGVLAMTGVLRGLQDTRTPLFVAVGASVGNVFLNVLLVYGLGLGIAGSAIGTVIAQWAAIGVFMFVVLPAIRSEGVALGLSGTGVLRSFRASAPLLVRNVSLRLVVVLSAVVAARIGEADLAAHQVAFVVWTALALGLDAVAIAGQALVGRYLGAADVTGAREATRRMVELSIAFGFVLALALLLTRDFLSPLFTPDAEVQRLLSETLLVIAIIQPAGGWVFALDGVLIGAGDARFLALAQALTVVAFAPLALLVLALDLGLTGLWWAIGAWVLARLVLLAWRQRGDAWAVSGATR
jgi:putative MATE family efflux protein